jgi:hypothetical protein
LHFFALSDKFISCCTVNFMVNFLLLHVEFYIDCPFRIVSLFYFTASHVVWLVASQVHFVRVELCLS